MNARNRNIFKFFIPFVAGIMCGIGFLSQKHDVTAFPYQSVSTCFTPEQKCVPSLVNALYNAEHTILVHSYSFTSTPIANALIRAHQNGLRVVVYTDKGRAKSTHSKIHLLQKAGIIVHFPKVISLFHNKTIIIDDELVITGSYNFSHAAEKRNSENMVFLRSKDLARRYSTRTFCSSLFSKSI